MFPGKGAPSLHRLTDSGDSSMGLSNRVSRRGSQSEGRSQSVERYSTGSGSVRILRCGSVPYHRDGQLVRGLTASVDRDRLCSIRDEVFDAGAVAANAERFPSVYDGQHLVGNNRLSPRQAKTLRDQLAKTYEVDTLKLTIEALVDCKIVLGRWLRPKEMVAVFGTNLKLVSKYYTLEAHPDDNAVSTQGGDKRVSFAIGPSGTALNDITSQAGCIYLWLRMVRKSATLCVYARNLRALDSAQRLLNQQQKGFHDKDGQHGFRVLPNKTPPQLVTLLEIYKLLNKRQ